LPPAPYSILRLLGNVVSGWLMGKVAAKAAQELGRGSDRTFLSAKLKSARYFADISVCPGTS
jgi:hypothetical protein